VDRSLVPPQEARHATGHAPFGALPDRLCETLCYILAAPACGTTQEPVAERQNRALPPVRKA
jgi:hypothetical protein